MLSIGMYRKNVLKTFNTKSSKLALKTVARNTGRTNLLVAMVGLRYETGNLFRDLTPYICGIPTTQEMTDSAYYSMGNIGRYLVVLAKLLKVKTPTASKKAKLTGTRTAALLSFSSTVTDMMGVYNAFFNYGVATQVVEKQVVIPSTGAKELRNVTQLDVEMETSAEAMRQADMSKFLSAAIDIYWRLCFDMFKVPPAVVFENNLTYLMTQYPGLPGLVLPDLTKEEIGVAPVESVTPVKAKKTNKKATPTAVASS